MKSKANTLIEILFYFSIFGVLMLVALTFAIQILNLNSLSSNIHHIQTDSEFILDDLVRSIQNADSVDVVGSRFDVLDGELSLNMSDAALSPTVYTFDSGNVFKTEGLNSPVQLNSDFVAFDHLSFHRVVTSNAPDQILIDALLVPSGQDISNLQQEISWDFSVTLRK